MKLAVTDLDERMTTVQVFPEVASHPLQPVKSERKFGVAVSVTVVPSKKLPVQLLPQLIPAGLEVMVPSPRRPDFCTVKVNCC